jgi:hypothetical protein
MIYNTPSNFIKDDGTLDIQSVTRYVIDEYEADPTRQQIRLPIDSTSLAVLRKSIGVVNNVTPQGGVILPTSSLVNGIVSGYVKSDNYVAGSTGWSIKGDGSAEFSNVTVRGYVAATSGTVGGWTINATSLQDTGGLVGMSSAVTAGDDIRFWAGNVVPASAPFYITEGGVIKATSGTIGPWTLSATAISTGAFDTLNTLYFGTSGLSLSNTFKVSTAGALTATGASISGTLTATAGTIGGFTLASNSLYAGTTTTRIQLSTADGIHLGATDFADAPFSVTLAGALKATSGTIGGWTLGATELYAGASTSKIGLDTSNGIYAGASDFATAPFTVSLAGVLTATGVDITGNINATTISADSGVIGGFTITPTQMYGGVIKTALAVNLGETGVIMDSYGLRGYNSVLGKIFDLPTDGSAPSFSGGIINSSIFNINTNAVIRTSSTVGDGTANSAGILINDTGLYACAANQTPATANVKVLIDGTAVFNASIRGGQTDYETGTGYFLGLSGGDYKFSIGSSTNYMKWDGTYLTLKGSFDVGSGGLINNAVYTVANLPIAPTSIGFNNPSAYE